jgi:glycosyltransferase involved in cell wall biosynthesis
MKILAVSSILPIPGIIKSNDFVFQTYLNYKKLHPGDEIVIIRPLRIDLNPLHWAAGLKRKEKIYKTRMLQGFRVETLAFLSSWRLRNLHSILTKTIYSFNKKKLDKLTGEYGFDIVHAQFILPDGLLAKYLHDKMGIPYVITTHNERFYFDHVLSEKLSKKILNEAASVYPINHSNYSFYKTIGIQNVVLIPLGFNDSFVRDQVARNTSPVNILTVCELIKLKNVDKVIRAVKTLSADYPVRYTIIGRGKESENLKQLTESIGLKNIISFIDHIPYEQIADEMHKHDIFIMPSYFETFGRVYFEAMAMGIPVICAKNSGIFGIFKENEEGISVEHRNMEEIINALKFLITNPEERARIGMNGKKLVEHFTWSSIAEKIHSEYTRILNRSRL